VAIKKRKAFEGILVFYIFLFSTDIFSPSIRINRFDTPFISFLAGRLATFAQLALVFYFLTFSFRKFLSSLFSDRILFCLLAWIVLSLIWTNHSQQSIQAIRHISFSVLFTGYLVNRFSPSETLTLSFWALVCVAFGSLLFWIFFPIEIWQVISNSPGSFVVSGFKGALSHKNHLGSLMLLALIISISLGVYKYVSWSLLLPVCTVFLFLLMISRSITNYVGFSLIFSSLLWRWIYLRLDYLQKDVFRKITYSVCFFLALTSFFWSESVILFLGKTTTLSGRTELWNYLLVAASKKPWLGYGFGAFWPRANSLSNFVDAQTVWRRLSWIPGSAHNGFIDVTLNLGLIGLLLSLFLVGSLFLGSLKVSRIYRVDRESMFLSWFQFNFVCFLILSNLTESFFITNPRSLSMYLFLYLVLYQAKRQQRVSCA